jgi:hypothetical protein
MATSTETQNWAAGLRLPCKIHPLLVRNSWRTSLEPSLQECLTDPESLLCTLPDEAMLTARSS